MRIGHERIDHGAHIRERGTTPQARWRNRAVQGFESANAVTRPDRHPLERDRLDQARGRPPYVGCRPEGIATDDVPLTLARNRR